MVRFVSVRSLLLVLAVALAGGRVGAAPLGPERLTDVRRSGDIFDARVCADPGRPGMMRCHARVVTDALGHPVETSVLSGPKGLGPAQLRSAYRIGPAAGAQTTIVAVADAYGYPGAEADLAVYRSAFGLPACTSANGCFAKYNQLGTQVSYPAFNVGWAQETALDLDMVSAMCPNCRIILVEANTAATADLAASVNTATRLGAAVVTNSYGGSESGSQPYESAFDHAGVAITASTGDSGYGIQFPASSPHVIAVGGTTLKAATGTTRGWTETAWRHGGSGCSAVYPKPAWQHDQSCTHRMEADVSAVSDPATGVAVYGPGYRGVSRWQVLGGTSVAAPLIGGVLGAKGGPFVPGSPYANPIALFDIVSGTNGTCPVAYFCTAEVGYDGPTGVGSPDGSVAF